MVTYLSFFVSLFLCFFLSFFQYFGMWCRYFIGLKKASTAQWTFAKKKKKSWAINYFIFVIGHIRNTIINSVDNFIGEKKTFFLHLKIVSDCFHFVWSDSFEMRNERLAFLFFFLHFSLLINLHQKLIRDL